MSSIQKDFPFNPSILKRRVSLFKPTLQDDEALKAAVQLFIIQYKHFNQLFKAPITWEKLSSGYRIVDLQIERVEEVLSHLKDHYFCSNHSCLATSLYIDSQTIKYYQQFILDAVMHQCSFTALEEGTGKIIGIVIATIKMTFNNSMENLGMVTSNKDIFNIIEYHHNILNEANIYETYGVKKYYCIHLVCVHPGHYGNGIGTSLIQTCLLNAQRKKYRVCIGIFPAGPSHSIAQKFNFQTLSELVWINIKCFKPDRHNRKSNLNTIENSYVMCMGISTKIEDEDEDEEEEKEEEGHEDNVLVVNKNI